MQMSLRAKRKLVRERMAELKERARQVRHAKRFSPEALAARAIRKEERELIRNTIRHYARKGLRITADGYATLQAKAKAEVAALRPF